MDSSGMSCTSSRAAAISPGDMSISRPEWLSLPGHLAACSASRSLRFALCPCSSRRPKYSSTGCPRRPYAGGAVALIIFLPNLIWEHRRNWATLELLRNIAHSNKDLPVGPWAYFVSNVHSLSDLSFPIWFGGILWCLFAKAGRRFRAIGWMWIVAYVTFIVLKGKTYYLTPIYAPLFAAGAVSVESLLEWSATKRAWLKPVLGTVIAVLILLYGMIGWPFAMPMMSVHKFIAYEQALGVAPEKWETISLNQLPQQYADMFGWPEMAAAVARVYDTIPPEERETCGILTRNYGEAAAIDYV